MMDDRPAPLPLVKFGSGEGPPVVFLHGFMGAAANWEPVAEHLEAHCQCFAVDLPGHGAATARPRRDYTMKGAAASLAATFEAALEAEGVRRPVVVGYSMGGRLALSFALAYPERCRGLVLESASPGLASEAERAARRRTDAQRARRMQADFRAFLNDWYRMPLFASLAQRGLAVQTIARRLENDPAELARSLAGMGTGRQPSLWPRLPELAMPAVVLAGALDAKYRRLTEAMAERSRGRLQRIVVEGAGHNIHVEQPERFSGLLEAFLREIRN